MNIIILNNQRGQSRSVQLPKHLPLFLLGLMVALPVVVGAGAWHVMKAINEPVLSGDMTRAWQEDLDQQRAEIGVLQQRSKEDMRALTLKLADAQARLVRLDALGERLLEVSSLKTDEFDFASTPAMGGPESEVEGEGVSFRPPSYVEALDELILALDRREQQLDILEDLMNSRNQARLASLAGSPVTSGWMSSRYGFRIDPFNGSRTMHKGVDFAAKEGSDIISTASGVVTFAGERWGYGNMVEVNHGNGLTTRYGHAKELLVEAGEIVKPGQPIAKVGSSGRSTGPHVHYEVLKHGRQVNPHPYIYRPRH